MSGILRWGIIGAGNIAHKLAEAVNLDPDSVLVSVASKSFEKAQKFAEIYNIDASQDYKSLVERNDIDIIYVATTHNFHFENTQLALEHGKHVLVEKPFTVNTQEAKNLVNLAKAKNLFLMEAIWVRFLPSMQKLKSLIDSGCIGEVRLYNLSFGGIAQEKYRPRLIDPQLAGGVTLDMGIYPITFVNFLQGELPTEVNSACRFAETGVDEIANYGFKYSNNCLANVSTSFNLLTKHEAMIYGTRGYIEFPHFQTGDSFTLVTHNGGETSQETQGDDRFERKSETFKVENHDNGFIYQVAECVRCIKNGLTESPTIPLSETVATMALMDKMRFDWGFVYPGEKV